ncbi:MAG: hypothetical protein PHR77_04125 [Kiritimatiellae bacterium]|nr:hypothetical protein [Kiritimatiellia bacterium]MDD5519354.1 hypothetical protein [Kiritimatiellia bacterium]
MDIKNKVIESQRKIIDALADCEIHIGSLYEKYAVKFPEMKTQWLGLANAEKTHYDLLKTMHRILDKGSIFYNLGKFGDKALLQMESLINESLKNADNPGLTSGDAISTAFKIETSVIDSHFYDVISSDAPEFKIIAQRLSADTKKHVEAIRNHFEQHSKG